MGNGPRAQFLPPDDPQPNIEVPETFYDFDRIGAKDIVNRTFLVRNNGEGPLTIWRPVTSARWTNST
jgi:hypothetical protein